MAIIYFLISLVATTAGAISGIGGGIIIKPVMDTISGMPISSINFLSGCTVLSMSIVSLLNSRNSSVKLEPRRGTFLAVGAAVGGIFGKIIFDTLNKFFHAGTVTNVIQSAMLLLLTLYVIYFMQNKYKMHFKNFQSAFTCIVVGLTLGMCSAFLGIGGGPINLAVLAYFFNMDSKTAALNSIYIIFFSQATNFASTIISRSVPLIEVDVLLFMVAGGILGGFLGRRFSDKLSNRQVDFLFNIILVLICLICSYNLIRYMVL